MTLNTNFPKFQQPWKDLGKMWATTEMYYESQNGCTPRRVSQFAKKSPHDRALEVYRSSDMSAERWSPRGGFEDILLGTRNELSDIIIFNHPQIYPREVASLLPVSEVTTCHYLTYSSGSRSNVFFLLPKPSPVHEAIVASQQSSLPSQCAFVLIYQSDTKAHNSAAICNPKLIYSAQMQTSPEFGSLWPITSPQPYPAYRTLEVPFARTGLRSEPDFHDIPEHYSLHTRQFIHRLSTPELEKLRTKKISPLFIKHGSSKAHWVRCDHWSRYSGQKAGLHGL